MENNLLKDFFTLEEFRRERPNTSILNDRQIQEAINISLDLLDGICNGLISLVVQYSLTKDKKDPSDPLFRTDFELGQLKRAMLMQTQYTLNLGNDFTIGSNSASTGGINYSFQRPEGRDVIGPGVRDFLARARVFEISNVGFGNKGNFNGKGCDITKLFLNIEDGDRRYLQKFQPNAKVGSIAAIGDGHTIEFVNPSNTKWETINAKKIVDKGGDYHYLWEFPNLAFFGDSVENAISKKEAYRAIWNAMWWNPMVSYPNEAIVNYYDYDNNVVYRFKSNKDNNLNHNPLKDNKDGFWWKEINSNDTIDIEAVANGVLDSKGFTQKLSDIHNEISNQFEAFWEQIKDNPHLMKKFEELTNYVDTNDDKIKQQISDLETRIDLNSIVRKNITPTKPQEFFNGNTSILKITTNNDNDVGLENNNGDMRLGAKNGIELTSTIKMVSQSDIRDPKQLTTKEYVDRAVANATTPTIDWNDVSAESLSIHNSNSLVGYDSNRTEIKYKNNSIRLNDDGGVFEIDGVRVVIDSSQFKVMNGTNLYLPRDENSIITKSYLSSLKFPRLTIIRPSNQLVTGKFYRADWASGAGETLEQGEYQFYIYATLENGNDIILNAACYEIVSGGIQSRLSLYFHSPLTITNITQIKVYDR